MHVFRILSLHICFKRALRGFTIYLKLCNDDKRAQRTYLSLIRFVLTHKLYKMQLATKIALNTPNPFLPRMSWAWHVVNVRYRSFKDLG